MNQLAVYSFTYLFIKVWVFANGRPWTFSSQSSRFLRPALQQEKRQALMYLIDSFRLVIWTERPGLHFPSICTPLERNPRSSAAYPKCPCQPLPHCPTPHLWLWPNHLTFLDHYCLFCCCFFHILDSLLTVFSCYSYIGSWNPIAEITFIQDCVFHCLGWFSSPLHDPSCLERSTTW